nr:homeodomain transcription factor bE [Pseudozyma pruni]
MNLSALLRELQQIEESVLAPKGEGYDLPPLLAVSAALKGPAIRQEGDLILIGKIQDIIERISVFSSALLRLESQQKAIEQDLTGEAAQILRRSSGLCLEGEGSDVSETLPTYHMRRHFLHTLDNPYPSQEEKEILVSITHGSAADAARDYSRRPPLEIHQLTLWFINARRRSGWSQILRKFARNDRSRMRHLVRTKMLASDPSLRPSSSLCASTQDLDDVLSDNLGRPLTSADKKDFEDDWASMINWLTYGVKDKVGDWVYDLVAANKKTHRPGQTRVVSTAVTRSPARKPVIAPQRKARNPKPRLSLTPSIESNTSCSGLDSTPEPSMCSTTDTSFSSLGSGLSMPHYDPFQPHDDLLQSPTLSAMGSRKVRALPKRAQQQLMPESLYTNGSGTPPATGTRLVKPEPIRPSLHPTHTQVNGGQTTSRHSTQSKQPAFPPFDVLGQAPMPVIRRESLSSNSLSAAFG